MTLRRRVVSAAVLVVALVLGLPGLATAREYRTAPSPKQSWVPDGRVYDILTVGDTVYIGGTFTRLRNPVTGQRVDRERLAAFDRATGALKGWNPAVNGRVRALSMGPRGLVLVGGLFTRAGGARRANFAALRPDGSAAARFKARPNGEVRDVLYSAKGLYVAGSFRRVDGARRVGLAKLNARGGTLEKAFNARLRGGRALTLRMVPRGLVTGGSFKKVAGKFRKHLALLDPATGRRLAWAPPKVCDSCELLELAVRSGRVYAAVAGQGGGRVAAWKMRGGKRLWVRRTDGDVQAIAVHDGTVYAGGHFSSGFGDQVRHQFAALATDGSLLPMAVAFIGRDAPGIWAVDARPDYLRLGGAFQGIKDSDSARYAAFPSR